MTCSANMCPHINPDIPWLHLVFNWSTSYWIYITELLNGMTLNLPRLITNQSVLNLFLSCLFHPLQSISIISTVLLMFFFYSFPWNYHLKPCFFSLFFSPVCINLHKFTIVSTYSIVKYTFQMNVFLFSSSTHQSTSAVGQSLEKLPDSIR